MIKYRVERGVVVLPRHLSPSAANMRVNAGEIFELDEEIKDRFLRRSLLNGDISVLQDEPSTTATRELAQKGPRK